MQALTFYATPDATLAFDEMGARWGVPPGQAVVRLTHFGLDVIEAVQMARNFVAKPGQMREVTEYGANRFQHFDEAGRNGGVSPLPQGSRRFPLLLADSLAQRMDKAAAREHAWRLAGRDYARRTPPVRLHSIMGWATYEGLVQQGHRLFPASYPYQRITEAVQRG